MTFSALLLAAAAFGLLLAAFQAVALARHARRRAPSADGPCVSILKPLCGVDDDLEANLASFAALDHPDYEVLLGLASRDDPAFRVAHRCCVRWPGRFRLLLQRGEPGLNPKVNQLLTLAAAARGEVLVVSDSNVRVHRAYLREIAGYLRDPRIGLVNHLVVGVGERRLGSLMDGLHLAGSIAPGVVSARLLSGRDVVIGKSMAFRRGDLEAMGGFEAVKDVLAEDFVLGRLVSTRLGKDVALAPTPVENVTRDRGVGDFVRRYQRWHVMQRRVVGPWVYGLQVLLNPVLFAAAATAAAPSGTSAAAFAGVCAAKTAIDAASARRLRAGGFSPRQLLLVPLKDLVVGAAWAHGLLTDRVDWRGRRLRVLPGTRLEPARPELEAPPAGELEGRVAAGLQR